MTIPFDTAPSRYAPPANHGVKLTSIEDNFFSTTIIDTIALNGSVDTGELLRRYEEREGVKLPSVLGKVSMIYKLMES